MDKKRTRSEIKHLAAGVYRTLTCAPSRLKPSLQPRRKAFGPQVGAQPDTPHGFDSAFLLVGDPNAPYANSIWPSFPIRYAMRRDQLYGIGGATTPTAVAAPRPTPSPAPVTPGGGGGVGF